MRYLSQQMILGNILNQERETQKGLSLPAGEIFIGFH